MPGPERIVVPKPPLGAKSWVMDRSGVFVLEEVPGNLFHITCTHAGNGGVVAWDGQIVDGRIEGRQVMRIQPMAMGVWHLNGGFLHGLVIEAVGNHSQIASIVWHAKGGAGLAARPSFTERKSAKIEKGRSVLTPNDCILYEVLITAGGAGDITLLSGKGRPLYKIPSMFRGSFNLEHVYSDGGLVAVANGSILPEVAVSWLEA